MPIVSVSARGRRVLERRSNEIGRQHRSQHAADAVDADAVRSCSLWSRCGEVGLRCAMGKGRGRKDREPLSPHLSVNLRLKLYCGSMLETHQECLVAKIMALRNCHAMHSFGVCLAWTVSWCSGGDESGLLHCAWGSRYTSRVNILRTILDQSTFSCLSR